MSSLPAAENLQPSLPGDISFDGNTKSAMEQLMEYLESPGYHDVSEANKRRKVNRGGVIFTATPTSPPNQHVVDALKLWQRAARWFHRSIDPFLPVPTVFRVGMTAVEADLGTANAQIDELVDTLSVDECKRYLVAFDTAVGRVPGGREALFSSVKNEHFVAIKRLIDLFDRLARQGHADDASSLRMAGLDYLIYHLPESEQQSFHLNRLSVASKALRGFNNVLFGRLLCPHRLTEQYMADPSAFCEKILSGEIEVTEDDYPAFAYGGPYNTDAIDEGLLRGPCVIKIYQHIFTAPQSARGGIVKRRGRQNQAELQDVQRVTPRTIAYAHIQMRNMLNACSEWSKFDGSFNAEKFFYNIVTLFEDDPNSTWAEETLDWWDMEVFKKGPRKAQVAIGTGTRSSAVRVNSDSNRLREQRRARQQSQ